MINRERIMVFSGEYHSYRLPVPGLWLDVFQKIKALSFSAVSFYTDWALFEGEPGVYNASGIFALESFFNAVSQAGIYLITCPGPVSLFDLWDLGVPANSRQYINAKSSGGGFPGWVQRIKGTDNYVAHVGATIAQYQITNGGPIILLQPENEYTRGTTSAPPVYFPDPTYMGKPVS
jgi:beta-galactosidase GanA